MVAGDVLLVRTGAVLAATSTIGGMRQMCLAADWW
jgi:hypothetical protein